MESSASVEGKKREGPQKAEWSGFLFQVLEAPLDPPHPHTCSDKLADLLPQTLQSGSTHTGPEVRRHPHALCMRMPLPSPAMGVVACLLVLCIVVGARAASQPPSAEQRLVRKLPGMD